MLVLSPLSRLRPLLGMVKSIRLQYAIVVLCATLVVGYGVSVAISWQADLVVALIGFALFAVTAGGLNWLMIGALNRQQRAVAELKAREEQNQGQSALLQSTLENMGEGLSVFDRHGRLIAWNSRFVELLDLPVEQLEGAASLHDILLHQAMRGDFGAVDPAVEVGKRIAVFYRDLPAIRERVTPGGRTLQIRRRAMPDGAVVTLYSDITERKASEEKMAQALHQAELANRAKSDFLANMSHELRTPLNAIVGFSEVICSEMLGPMVETKYLEYVKDIHASGLHLLSIINDVLDMSRIEAGKLQLASERVTVQRVIAESIRMVSERARSRNIELVRQLPAAEIGVSGDERAIKQIMLNLLSNAVKFSHDGGRVDVRAVLDGNGELVIGIEDCGIGMSDEEVERAVQPFWQAKSVTTKVQGGTGLGLPITKGLVEAHGGTLQIASQPGRGTLVRVTLPIQPGGALALAPPAGGHDGSQAAA
jgi:signal transduction histidine kinase